MLKTKRRAIFAVAFAFVLALASLTSAQPAQSRLDFRLRTADGGEITSEMLRGDVVVLAFGASWLPLSREQVRSVQEVADEFGARNVRVYWVSTDSDKTGSKNYASDEQLRAFARKHGLKAAVLRDPDGAFFKRLSVPGNQLPAIVLLDRTGAVSVPSIGGLDPESKLNRLLGEQ
jgi:peroxiredoxin